MIRRTPTLIPMSDLDVQDIRDMVALQQREAAAKQTEKPKFIPSEDDVEMNAQLRAAGLKQERTRRLGLELGA